MTNREWALLATDIANPDTWAVWADMVAERDEGDMALLAYHSGGPVAAIKHMAGGRWMPVSQCVDMHLVEGCMVLTNRLRGEVYGFRSGPISRLERLHMSTMVLEPAIHSFAQIGRSYTMVADAARQLADVMGFLESQFMPMSSGWGNQAARRLAPAAKQRTYPVHGTRNPMRRGDKGKHGRARR